MQLTDKSALCITLGSSIDFKHFEDTDLCFKAKAIGKKVIYTPFSKVYHYEGMSNGTDTNSGINVALKPRDCKRRIS